MFIPLVKVIHDNLIIVKGLIRTVHIITSNQKTASCSSGRLQHGECWTIQNINQIWIIASKAGHVIPDLKLFFHINPNYAHLFLTYLI